MKLTPTYQSITKTLEGDARLSHSSPGRGTSVFVRAGVGFHDLLITGYPIDSMRGPVIPRLNIDKSWSMRRLPQVAAKRWGLQTGVEKIFTQLGLEITVLEDQLCLLADAVPVILHHIETGSSKGFENLLPFDTHLTTTTNIWSIEARELAKGVYRKRQRR